METKKWWQSRTVWANVIAVMVGVGLYFGVQPDSETLQKTGEVLSLVIPVANILLRLITKKPIQ